MAETLPQFPLLVLDAASKRCFVGLKRSPDHLDFIATEQEATKSLFSSLKTLLSRNQLNLAEIRSIAFCEGPGSMLGIRTTIMAIRTWVGAAILKNATLYAFSSLSLGQRLVQQMPGGPSRFLVLTDARRQSWNALECDSTGPDSSKPIILDNIALEQSEFPAYSFAEFPAWTQTNAPLLTIAYQPERLFEKDDFLSVLQNTDAPAPLSLRPSEYKKWFPKFNPALPAQP